MKNCILIAALFLTACSTAPATQPHIDGTLRLDAADYAASLRPHYERAIYACQGAQTAPADAFTWSGWVAADGHIADSDLTPPRQHPCTVDLLHPRPDPYDLARCVREKLKRTMLPPPPEPAPFLQGYPVFFHWTP